MTDEQILKQVVALREKIAYIPGASTVVGWFNPVIKYGAKGLQVLSIISRAIPIKLPDYTPPPFRLIRNAFQNNPPLAELYQKELSNPAEHLFKLQRVHEALFYCVNPEIVKAEYDNIPSELIDVLASEFEEDIRLTENIEENTFVSYGLPKLELDNALEYLTIIKSVLPELIKLKELDEEKLLTIVEKAIRKSEGGQNEA
jgi:hypothetical protein